MPGRLRSGLSTALKVGRSCHVTADTGGAWPNTSYLAELRPEAGLVPPWPRATSRRSPVRKGGIQ